MPKHLTTLPTPTGGGGLPNPSGMAEGYPFLLDGVLYAIQEGEWVAIGSSGGGGGEGGGGPSYAKIPLNNVMYADSMKIGASYMRQWLPPWIQHVYYEPSTGEEDTVSQQVASSLLDAGITYDGEGYQGSVLRMGAVFGSDSQFNRRKIGMRMDLDYDVPWLVDVSSQVFVTHVGATGVLRLLVDGVEVTQRPYTETETYDDTLTTGNLTAGPHIVELVIEDTTVDPVDETAYVDIFAVYIAGADYANPPAGAYVVEDAYGPYAVASNGYLFDAYRPNVAGMGDDSLALGYQAVASGYLAVAIGHLTSATHIQSTAFGRFAATTKDHQFMVEDQTITSTRAEDAFEALEPGAGVVLRSPDDTAYRITVDNTGAVIATAVV